MFSALIDSTCQEINSRQKPRSYLGASRLGESCERKLRYEFEHAPTDKEHKFPGPIIRIFDMGHDAEARLITYMREAGFEIITHSAVTGMPIGFKTMDDKIAGHIDGYIISGPDLPGFKYPMLWECKALNDKSWNDTLTKGVKASKPIYYGQMNMYCAYLEIENGSLFTAINRNTGEVFAELVPYDARNAQESSDRGVRVVGATDPSQLARAGRTKSDFCCKFCDYKTICWKEAKPSQNFMPGTPSTTMQSTPAVPAQGNAIGTTPAWMSGSQK